MDNRSRTAPFGLRMAPDLRERVQNAADSANLSLNALICFALEEAFPPLTPIETAIERYNGLTRKMRSTTDPQKRDVLAKEREQALKEVAQCMND